MTGLDTLVYDNSFVAELPADTVTGRGTRQVRGACYSRVEATPVAGPRLVAWSAEVARMLGLSEAAMADPATAEVLGGNRVAEGMAPYAACYGGHQFGQWAGQLGDGRAITLGETVTADGERWELQLKGAGPTPYSRHSDGRAVMRSSVREFLCSEAMHHLGVPTTRALSLVDTGDTVVRDMFYNGNPRPERGAIVCRVAPSFLRFGSYEIFASRGETDLLRRLVDYTLRHHFPALGAPGPETYVAWYEEVGRRTAALLVEWMRVGFVHGVMNTDNMSILGLTIDYGPYGWLDSYDPDWTPNTTDAQHRRYRYGQQPQVGMWNLAQLANALVALIGDPAPLQAVLDAYPGWVSEQYRRMMAAKLGLRDYDEALVTELRALLVATETDMTIFHRRLADVPLAEEVEDGVRCAPLAEAHYTPDQLGDEYRGQLAAWLRRYAGLARSAGVDDRARTMRAVNPRYVLRNYIAQLAIDKAEQGDGTLVAELLEVLRRPYAEQPEKAVYAEKRPEWARHRPGCSTLSCSS